MANKGTNSISTRSSRRIAGKTNPTGNTLNIPRASTSNEAILNNFFHPPGSNPTSSNTIPNLTNNINNNNMNVSQSSAQGANSTVVGIGVPPGPQNHTSPESQTSVTRPSYSSLTAQNASLPILSENVNLEAHINSNDGPTLREYISASVRISQSEAMRTMENRLELLRESIDSLRNISFNISSDPQRPVPGQSVPSFQQQNNHYPRPRQQVPNIQQQNNDFPRLEAGIPLPNFPQQNNNFTRLETGNQVPNSRHPNYNSHQQQQSGQNEIPNYFRETNSYKLVTPLQMQKWGLKFDGTSKIISVEEFIFRAESLRFDYNCPWDIFLKGFHHLLAGRAYEWFWQFRQQNPFCDWHHLKYNFTKKFKNFESDFEIQRKIIDRRQLPSESADIFISEIVKLKNQMRVPIPEFEIVRIAKDNLKEGLVQLIYAKNIESIDDLIEECRRPEVTISKRVSYRQQQQHTYARRVHELDLNNSEDQYPDIEAIYNSNIPTKQITCWNCKNIGHSFIECEMEPRNIFCYKCGFSGVTSPKCPNCVGNPQKNMGKTGSTCSPKDLPQ